MLQLHGLGRPVRQHRLTDPATGRRRYLDLAYVAERVAPECDGRLAHGPRRCAHDADREDWLGGYGSFKRRLYRLAHISFFGLAIVNLMFCFVALYGASNGVMTIVRAIIPVELFGRESYGTINGALSAPVIASRAAGPLAASIVWSSAGGYDAVLWCLVGLAAVAVIGFAFASRGRMGSSHS